LFAGTGLRALAAGAFSLEGVAFGGLEAGLLFFIIAEF